MDWDTVDKITACLIIWSSALMIICLVAPFLAQVSWRLGKAITCGIRWRALIGAVFVEASAYSIFWAITVERGTCRPGASVWPVEFHGTIFVLQSSLTALIVGIGFLVSCIPD